VVEYDSQATSCWCCLLLLIFMAHIALSYNSIGETFISSTSETILERGIRQLVRSTNRLVTGCAQPSQVPCESEVIQSRAKASLSKRLPGLDWKTAKLGVLDSSKDSCQYSLLGPEGVPLLVPGVDVTLRFKWDPTKCDSSCCTDSFWPTS
jgi:hypothetical protein